MAGWPVFGVRSRVEFILDLVGAEQSEADILANYPGLAQYDILACLVYASQPPY